MPEEETDELGLAEAIIQIKTALAAAQTAPAPGGLRLPMKSVTVELKVVAKKSANAKAGFKVPVVNLELSGDGAISHEQTHTITLVFDAPLDTGGNLVKIGKASNHPGV